MWHPWLGEGSGQLRPCHLQCGQRAELRAEALQRRELRDLGRDAHRLLTERLGVGLAEQLTGERTERLGVGLAEPLTRERTERLPARLPERRTVRLAKGRTVGLTERHTDWLAERLGEGLTERLTVMRVGVEHHRVGSLVRDVDRCEP